METVPNQIEKQTVLRAPLERVWQAIIDSKRFGTWFGVEFDGPFVFASTVTGRISPTKVDPEVAKLQEPYRGTPFVVHIEAVEPMRRFAFRWHPYPVDDANDFTNDPGTLVTFELDEVSEGVHLTITESGFDRIPIERRASVFAGNEGGWRHQLVLITKYTTETAQIP
jgi:uncharacterized protein YndB with AHSA1/START domain